jgi:hypothetical protein
MAGKIKMPEDELDDPSLLVPETPDQTHRTFVNPEHRLRRLESMIDEYEDTQKAILQKLNLLMANIEIPPHHPGNPLLTPEQTPKAPESSPPSDTRSTHRRLATKDRRQQFRSPSMEIGKKDKPS